MTMLDRTRRAINSGLNALGEWAKPESDVPTIEYPGKLTITFPIYPWTENKDMLEAVCRIEDQIRAGKVTLHHEDGAILVINGAEKDCDRAIGSWEVTF